MSVYCSFNQAVNWKVNATFLNITGHQSSYLSVAQGHLILLTQAWHYGVHSFGFMTLKIWHNHYFTKLTAFLSFSSISFSSASLFLTPLSCSTPLIVHIQLRFPDSVWDSECSEGEGRLLIDRAVSSLARINIWIYSSVPECPTGQFTLHCERCL